MPPSRFLGECREWMLSRQPDFRAAQASGTVREWLSQAFQDFILEFPVPDDPTPAFERKKTLSGKTSLARPEGVPKPFREVRRMITSVIHCF